MWNLTNRERSYLKLQKEAERNIIKFDNFLLNRIKKLVAFLLVYQNILLILGYTRNNEKKIKKMLCSLRSVTMK